MLEQVDNWLTSCRKIQQKLQAACWLMVTAAFMLQSCATATSRKISTNQWEITVSGSQQKAEKSDLFYDEAEARCPETFRMKKLTAETDHTFTVIVTCYTNVEANKIKAGEAAAAKAEEDRAQALKDAKLKEEAKAREEQLAIEKKQQMIALEAAILHCRSGGEKKKRLCIEAGSLASELGENKAAAEAFASACSTQPLDLPSCQTAKHLAVSTKDSQSLFIANSQLCIQLEGIACGDLYLSSLGSEQTVSANRKQVDLKSPNAGRDSQADLLKLATALLVSECDAHMLGSCEYLGAFMGQCDRTKTACKDVGLYVSRRAHDIEVTREEENLRTKEHNEIVDAQRETARTQRDIAGAQKELARAARANAAASERAASALELQNTVHAFEKAFEPPPSTSITCNTYGNSTYCH